MEQVISFTRSVKEEISSFEYEDNSFNKALLSGFIKINSHLVIKENKWLIDIKSENIKTAKLIIKLLEKQYNVKTRISILEQKRFKTNNPNKTVKIEVIDKAKEILNDLEIYNNDLGFNVLPKKIINNAELIKGYLTGCFLASGSVNSPTSKNYHLEIATDNNDYAKFLVSLFKKFYLEAKIIERRSQFVVYIKKGESIADFLKVLNASNSLLFFEDVRIRRDTKNSVNRLINCEISNQQKILEVANDQFEKISWYKERYGLEGLNRKLLIVAQARLASPDSSYVELAKEIEVTFGEALSKPGLAYRMNKLLELIEKRKGDL